MQKFIIIGILTYIPFLGILLYFLRDCKKREIKSLLDIEIKDKRIHANTKLMKKIWTFAFLISFLISSLNGFYYEYEKELDSPAKKSYTIPFPIYKVSYEEINGENRDSKTESVKGNFPLFFVLVIGSYYFIEMKKK